VADNSSERVAETKRRSFLADFFIRLVKEKPLGNVGGAITLVLLVTAIFAELLAPYGMNETNLGTRLLPPSTQYWLGTDNLGRDLLTRIIFGARISVIIGLGAAVLATLISTIVGILCGYLGGKFDLLVQRVVDAVMCIPGLIIMMFFSAIIGGGIWQMILVLGVVFSIAGSRIVRGAVMSVTGNVYVEAAVAIGCSTPRILARHIIPNIMPPNIILFTMRVPNAILTEAALSFLGFGIPPPFPSWGGMLSGSGRTYMFQAPWMAIWPGLALALVVYGINIFGDAVRDLIDPRLRGGVGRYGVKVKKEEYKK